MKKVGIVGSGKRFLNVYREILDSLGCNIFIWNRTKEKLKIFENIDNYSIVDKLEDFKNLNLDLVLCFLPSEESFDVVGNIDFGTSLLIETPVSDQRWLQNLNPVGVLEQWIYLPIEQVKEEIYNMGIISRPYWVFNDGRSFDYHGISQLRKYCLGSRPISFFGKIQDFENRQGFVDKSGNINRTSDFWTHGQTMLEKGELLMHSFAYNCKQSILKPIQLLRAYSVDGSIISGRMENMDDDYEKFSVTYCDKNRRPIIEKAIRTVTDESTTKSIELSGLGIYWRNPYVENSFNDQQTAIAMLLKESFNGNLYTVEQGFYDFLTINAMKQSHMSNTILSVRK